MLSPSEIHQDKPLEANHDANVIASNDTPHPQG